jgi:hypothetical protein
MNNDPCVYKGVERRQHCELITTLNTQFQDFINHYMENQNELKGWRKTNETNLNLLTESIGVLSTTIHNITQPYVIFRKGVRWGIVIVLAGFLTAFGISLWELVKRVHFG